MTSDHSTTSAQPAANAPRWSGFPFRACFLGCLLPAIVLVALIAPVLMTAYGAARSAACYANGNYLNNAISMYAADHDDRLPPANQWADVIRPYTKLSRDVDCTTRPNAIGPHAFNAALDCRLTAKVNDQSPKLFESNAGKRNHSDLLGSFTRPHEGKGYVILGGGMVRAYKTPPDARFGQ